MQPQDQLNIIICDIYKQYWLGIYSQALNFNPKPSTELLYL